MWLWNLYLVWESSVQGVSKSIKCCLSICNHGTAAMMAVTVLLGKTLASSRRLDSVLDTSRLKHAIILVNPRLWMVRMLEMVPAVPHGNFTFSKAFKMKQKHNKNCMSLYPDISLNKISTSKDTEAPSKTTSLCQEITWCARKSYLGLGHLTMALWLSGEFL